jgi:hypothetical protein
MIWLFLVLFLVVTNSLNPDEATHSFVAKFFKDAFLDWLKTPTFSYKKIYDYAISYLVYYPKLSLQYTPIPQIFFAVAYIFFGTSVLVSRLVVMAFAVAFLYLIKDFTYKISKNEKAAFISALIFMSSPIFIYNSIAATQEISFLFFFTLTIFLYRELLKNDSRKNQLLAITSTVFCILSKWQAALIVPFLLVFVYFEDKNKIKKILVPIIISLLILTPYYLIQFKTGLLLVPFNYNINADAQDPTWKEPAGLLFYLKVFILEQFPFVGVILLFSTIYYIVKKKSEWKLFLTWILVIYIIMTFIHNKDTRYDINMMPAFVIPSSIIISELCKGKRKKLLLLFFILLLIQFVYTIKNNIVYLQNAEFISRYVVLNLKGNILTDFSQFAFEISKIDNFRHQLFRTCLINDSNESYEKILSKYGIEYIILDEKSENSLYENISESKNFTKEIELENVVVFRNKNFVLTQQKELCNYICSTKQIVCSKFKYPKDALD